MFFVTVNGDPLRDTHFGPFLRRPDALAWIEKYFPDCPCTVNALLPPVSIRRQRLTRKENR